MSWAEIKKSVNSNLNKPLDQLLNESVNSNFSKPLDVSINEVKATNLIANGSAVKSVQRGVFSGETYGGTNPPTSIHSAVIINIAAVNPIKCKIRIYGSDIPNHPSGSSGAFWSVGPGHGGYVVSLTATTISIMRGYGVFSRGGSGYEYAAVGGSYEIEESY